MAARILATALLAALLAPAPLAAHPHVWINSVLTFLFEDDRLTGLRLEWAFDEFFGDFVIHEFGVVGEGPVDPDTQAVLEAEAFSALRDLDYLTHIRLDGAKQSMAEIADFAAAVENGVLVYRFTLALPEPVDPTRTEVHASLYDETFYIDVMLDEHDPVRFEGIRDGACVFRIREDSDNAIYFGLVYPLVVDLDCPGL